MFVLSIILLIYIIIEALYIGDGEGGCDGNCKGCPFPQCNAQEKKKNVR